MSGQLPCNPVSLAWWFAPFLARLAGGFRVDQTAGRACGTLTGVSITHLGQTANVDIDQKVDVVSDAAKVVGVQLGALKPR